jgi:hypothetical protein
MLKIDFYTWSTFIYSDLKVVLLFKLFYHNGVCLIGIYVTPTPFRSYDDAPALLVPVREYCRHKRAPL